MQPAFNYHAVREFNRAAPALASVPVRGKVDGEFTVEVYRDYYGTANARVMTFDGIPVDTQHNGFGWAKRRHYGSEAMSGIPLATLRAFDLAAAALFAGLKLHPGAAIPKGRKFCTVCGDEEQKGQSCLCHDNHCQ